MKLKKILSALFVTIALGALGFLAFLHPDWILYFGRLTFLPGYFLILLCLLPIGKLTLGSPDKKPSFSEWLVKLFQGHVVLAVFTGVAYFAFISVPGPRFVEPPAWQTLSLAQWGIFPWGIYGLWGLVIAYCAYIKEAPPYLYAIVHRLWPKRLEPMVKTFIESTDMTSTLFGFGLVTGAILIAGAYIIESLWGVYHSSASPITFSILACFMALFLLKSTKRLLRHWQSHRTLTTVTLGSMMIILVLLALSAFANQWFIEHYAPMLKNLYCQECAKHFAQIPLVSRVEALYWGWWLLWTPLAGSYIASISKGRTLREFVLGLFAFPFVIGGITYVVMHSRFSFSFSPSIIRYGMMPLLIVMACWFLIKLLNRCKDSGFFLSGYMQVPSHFKANRLWVSDSSKVTGWSKVAPRIISVTFGVIFLQLTAGWYGIQIQVALIGVIIIDVIYAALAFMIVRLISTR